MILTSDHVAALVRAGLSGPLLVSACRELESVRCGSESGSLAESAPKLNEADSNGPLTVAKLNEADSSPVLLGSGQKAVARMALSMGRGLRPAARQVGAVLIECFNLKSGRCDPGEAYIAEKTGFVVRSVRRAINELEAAGLFAVTVHGGRRHANAYRPIWAALTALASRSGNGFKMNEADSTGANRTSESPEADSRVRQNLNQKLESLLGVERQRARPDPRQREFMYPIPTRAGAAAAGAERRVMDDIERVAKARPSFSVYGLTEANWADVHAAETQRRGAGIDRIRELLGAISAGPPSLAASG